mgnify:CR=1 FL=1
MIIILIYFEEYFNENLHIYISSIIDNSNTNQDRKDRKNAIIIIETIYYYTILYYYTIRYIYIKYTIQHITT